MGALDDVQLGPVPEERYGDVIQHLRHSFFADEPLNSAVQLCRPGEPHAELEHHSLSTLADGLSQMAVHVATGEVVGVALNGVQRPGDLKAAQAKLAGLADLKFRLIFDLLYSANLRLDLFAEHGVDRLFECRILSVDRRFRGRGLARALLLRSEEVARQHGFKVFKEDATGFFSQRVAESVGLRAVSELKYCEHIAPETGEAVFKTQPPHESLKIMVKILQ
ncbi:uncharacterized protein LOC134530495 [Bacillus rossius redtenbacheri]|uniref:uncharacterized protein LOC134530495 n=1 Tax=Bacillus rossius redtenbacheri TaxID=93214 RepID=UPI002FDD048E